MGERPSVSLASAQGSDRTSRDGKTGTESFGNRGPGEEARAKGLGLKFPPAMERQFRHEYYQKSLPSLRLSLLLGVALYSLFGILDYQLAREYLRQFWTIRFLVVCPLLLAVFALTYLPFFERIMQLAIALVGVVAGFGIIVIIGVAKGEAVALYYYAGLILVIMWSYTFVRLRFLYATIACWLVLLAYEAVSILYLGMLAAPTLANVLLSNSFFFVAANVLGMFVNYLFEQYARNDFQQDLLIVEKQAAIETASRELLQKNSLIKDELEIARGIQLHLVPQEAPNDRLFFLYAPEEEIGGDFLDFVRFEDENKIGIFMSDVSGHGVPAALVATMVKSIIVEARAAKDDPAGLLMHLNDALARQVAKSFVTALYGVYDFQNRRFRYAIAGQNPPLLSHGGKVAKIESGEHFLPLAVLGNDELTSSGKSYRNFGLTLPANSRLLIYTDGLVEAKNPKGEDFGGIIRKSLGRLDLLSPKELVYGLFDELLRFKEGEGFEDDISMICLDTR